jgi:hypothetical protein
MSLIPEEDDEDKEDSLAFEANGVVSTKSESQIEASFF